MTLTISCPGCNSPLQVREEYAGQQLKCPRCAAVVSVPAAEGGQADAAPVVLPVEAERVEEIRPVPRAVSRQAAPDTAIGEGRPAARPRAPRDAEDEAPRPGRRGRDYHPCPRCGSGGATRVTWTPWGSFYGPALLTHVRCPKCGYAYNGRTGRSNTVAAVFFVLVPLILILAILFGLLVALGVLRLR